MNIQRIQQLRNFIAKLPPAACDMDSWIICARDDKGKVIPLRTSRRRGFTCGMAGCLGGWTQVMIATPRTRFDEGGCLLCELSSADYFELEPAETAQLFYSFPQRDPKGGWKRWMLRRLDGVIRDGRIMHYRYQMRQR